jgi:5'-deoxynucleotidase YfbR-like HD superfamily hydrolase
VHRYHTARTVRGQTVAEHSWGVAVLVRAVLPEASAQILAAALMHDVSETYTGDIPAPAKWDIPALAAAEREASEAFNQALGIQFPLSSFEHQVLKWCDMMELVLWCLEECRMGNTFAEDMLRKGINSLLNRETPTDEAHALFTEVIEAASQFTRKKEDWYA